MLNLVTPIQETKAYDSICAEGEVKGKAEGKAERLNRLLARRFGPLPVWATQRVEAAPVAQLDAWLDGIFEATSVEGLIGDAAAEATPVFRLYRIQKRRRGAPIDPALHG